MSVNGYALFVRVLRSRKVLKSSNDEDGIVESRGSMVFPALKAHLHTREGYGVDPVDLGGAQSETDGVPHVMLVHKVCKAGTPSTPDVENTLGTRDASQVHKVRALPPLCVSQGSDAVSPHGCGVGHALVKPKAIEVIADIVVLLNGLIGCSSLRYRRIVARLFGFFTHRESPAQDVLPEPSYQSGPLCVT